MVEPGSVDGVRANDADELKAALLELSHAVAVAESEKNRREAVTGELERYRELAVSLQRRDRKIATNQPQSAPNQTATKGLSNRIARKINRKVKASSGVRTRSVEASSDFPGKRMPGWSAAMERDLSSLFDEAYYKSTYKDVSASGLSPRVHFKKIGLKENRTPSPLFDPQWYSNHGEAGSPQRTAPLAHYLRKGAKKGFDPVPEFDTDWYLSSYPEVYLLGINPLAHYVSVGASNGCDPNPLFNSRWYLETYPDVKASGTNPLAHYLAQGKAEGRVPSPSGEAGGHREYRPEIVRTVPDEIEVKWPQTSPLRIVESEAPRRINMVTDSINKESLFGGVASAAILAAMWAEKIDCPLRVVTTQRPPQIGGLLDLLAMNEIELSSPPECVFIAQGSGDSLEVSRDDLYLSTSWWSTTAVLAAVPPSCITYILQEDERMFYPSGDEQLMAQRAMNHPDIRVVVNTDGLLQRLRDTGIDNLATTAVSFEPSFALYSNSPRKPASNERKNLFFYARPGNPRNLFRLGLLALDRAIQNGVIDTEQWTINFVGARIPRIQFSDGTVPTYHEGLPWRDYRDLLGRMDLGFSLMSTPHPSYPPLDLAASGAVVVTNSWPGKQDLTKISGLIHVAPPTIEGLVRGLQAGVSAAIAADPAGSLAPPYCDSWRSNLAAVVDQLADGS